MAFVWASGKMSLSQNSEGRFERVHQFCYSRAFRGQPCNFVPTTCKTSSTSWCFVKEPCVKTSDGRSQNRKTEKLGPPLLSQNAKDTVPKKTCSFHARHGRNCYFFDFESKRFAEIDETEAIRELNNWQPQSTDTLKDISEESEMDEAMWALYAMSLIDVEEQSEINEYVSGLIDDILHDLDNEIERLFEEFGNRKCTCDCGLLAKDCICTEVARLMKKKRDFHCYQCGLTNDCICSILDEIFAPTPCDECGLDNCICKTLNVLCIPTVVNQNSSTGGGYNAIICCTLQIDSSVSEEGEYQEESICICGCGLEGCICCIVDAYLNPKKQEFIGEELQYSETIQEAFSLTQFVESVELHEPCTCSCNMIDCICNKRDSFNQQSQISTINQQINVNTSKYQYDCKNLINYFRRNKQNKVVKNQFIDNNQNGNYCAICGYFNCPCTAPNASSDTTICDM